MAVGRARAVDDLPPGTVVGEYRIDRKLATGGMGSVYAATHPVIGRRAAVKVLRKELCASDEVVARFVDEARAVNRIGHKHIVDVFAFGALQDGRSYFVMEWLDGETLYALIEGRRLSRAQVFRVLEQLCDAVEAAHQAGVLHRDLKPENVIVREEKEGLFVTLLDFGVAKLGEYTHASERHSVLGTPSYISPEQASAHPVDQRTDIYSLGVLAYELLVGERPFFAATPVELLSKHIHQQPPSPRAKRPDLAPVLERLILAMLAKDREERPTLEVVRRTLADARRAEALTEVLPPRRGRPYVRRRFADLGGLARPLMTELSAGMAWIRASGDPPPVGTPIAIRFEVEALGARIDLAGIVSRHFGATAEKVLVRYDPVDKEPLDRVFTVLTQARSRTPSGAGEGEATWQAPGDTGRMLPPVDVNVESPATLHPEAAPRKRGLGVRAKVAALTASIAVLAVGATAAIALQRATVDRTFYARDLTVRTAQMIARAADDRIATLEQRLTVAGLGGVDGKMELGPLRSLSVCRLPLEPDKCTAAAGERPDPELLQAIAAGLGDDLYLERRGLDLLAAKRTGPRVAIATMPRTKLANLDQVPNDLTVVIQKKGEVLLRRGALELPTDTLVADDGSVSGADELELPSGPQKGTRIHFAHSSVGEILVIVGVPASLSSAQTGELTRQISVVALVVMGLSLLVALVFATRTTRRLRTLASHAAKIAEGDFSVSADVGGRDEVGHLASSLDAMSSALSQRDADVLRIQRKMSEDESQAMQRHMSEWLETDLASKLTQIGRLASAPGSPERDVALQKISSDANASLEHALAFAVMASRRVDIASTVADAVAYARAALHGSGVAVELVQPNAVMFPRLDARESELRELVQTVVLRSGRGMSKVVVSLTLKGDHLELSIGAPDASAAMESAAAVDAIVNAHKASCRVVSGEGRAALVVELPLPKESA